MIITHRITRMVPRRIESENRRVVECDSAKQEYDYGS